MEPKLSGSLFTGKERKNNMNLCLGSGMDHAQQDLGVLRSSRGPHAPQKHCLGLGGITAEMPLRLGTLPLLPVGTAMVPLRTSLI